MPDKNITNEEFESQLKKYPTPGLIYKNFKGGLYEFMFVATDSETKEDVAVYKSVHRGTIYTRPLKEWFDKIIIDKEGEPSVTILRYEPYGN